MSEVDPFIIKIPNFLWNHPDPEVRNYFQYLNRWAQDMWIRTGADQDNIANQAVRESYAWRIGRKQPDNVNYSVNISKKGKVIVTTGSNYTLTGYEDLLIVTGSVTITVNPNPKDGEEVAIKRSTTAGYVTISGTIDGDSSHVMTRNYDGVDLIYSVSNAGWFVV